MGFVLIQGWLSLTCAMQSFACIYSVSRSPQVSTRTHIAPSPASPVPPLAPELLPQDAPHPHAPIASRLERIRARGSPLLAIFCIQQYVQVVSVPLVLICFPDSAYCYSARVHTGSICLCAPSSSRAFRAAYWTAQLCERLAPRGTVTAGQRCCVSSQRCVLPCFNSTY